MPSMALQFVKAADEIAWGRSTPCSADYSHNTPYTEACCVLGIQSLDDSSCWELCRTLFKQIVNNEFCSLHYLLPAKRNTQLISRLRSTTVYPTFCAWINWFKNSFFCLWQWQSRHVILFHWLLCACVYVCICVIILIQLLVMLCYVVMLCYIASLHVSTDVVHQRKCVIGKLRHPSIFKLPHVHTTRSKTSFINYALDHYIWFYLAFISKLLYSVLCVCLFYF